MSESYVSVIKALVFAACPVRYWSVRDLVNAATPEDWHFPFSPPRSIRAGVEALTRGFDEPIADLVGRNLRRLRERRRPIIAFGKVN